MQRFEICIIRQLGKKFGKPKNFIDELERLVSDFYEAIGQHLRAYQSSAPPVRKDRSDPESVTPEKLQDNEEIQMLGKTSRKQPQSQESRKNMKEFRSAVSPANEH